MYKVYMKTIFTSRIFWIALVINIFALYVGTYQSLIVHENVLDTFESGTSYGATDIVASVMFPMPFFVLLVEEMNKKVMYYQILRSSKTRYLLSQIAAAVTSVTLMYALVIGIFTLMCMAYGCGFALSDNALRCYGTGVLRDCVYNRLPLFYFLVYLSHLLIMLPGILFTFPIACYVKNKYILLAMPLIVFRAFQILSSVTGQPYVDWLYISLPEAAHDCTVPYLAYCFLYPLALCVCAAAMYFIAFRRRFVNGKM